MENNFNGLIIENLTEQELQNIDGGFVISTTVALIACCFAAGLGAGLLI